jgi:hypothetical protein
VQHDAGRDVVVFPFSNEVPQNVVAVDIIDSSAKSRHL